MDPPGRPGDSLQGKPGLVVLDLERTEVNVHLHLELA